MKITDEEVMKSKEQRQKNNRTMKQMKSSKEMKILLKEYKPDQDSKTKRARTPNGCKQVTFFLMSRGLKVPLSQVIHFILVNYIF